MRTLYSKKTRQMKTERVIICLVFVVVLGLKRLGGSLASLHTRCVVWYDFLFLRVGTDCQGGGRISTPTRGKSKLI